MIDIINRYLIFPAYMKWNNDTRLRYLKKYQVNQWLSSDELQSRQFADFQSIIRYAYEQVPFYTRRFDSVGIRPEDIRCPDDVKLIPMLTKKDLQENLESLVSLVCPPSQRYRDSSGGSTGQPTTFYGDLSACPSKDAAMLLTDTWTGWRVGEKSAYLWGADREVNRVRNLKEQFVQKFVFRKSILNAFRMNDQDMDSFARFMQKESPAVIVAYSNAIYRFALFVQQHGISGIAPKGIVCSAETLLEDRRKTIESVFNCKALSRYGSREVGLIGSECQHQQGLHINTAGVYLELMPVVKEAADSPCEIIITDLENRAMPFIRYNTGDTSYPVNKRCDCGRGLPLIGCITGRTSDFIVHPDGNLIHGEYFSHAFYGIPGVVQFQIVQPTISVIEIKVVANHLFTAAGGEQIRNKICEAFDERVCITVAVVDEIPTPPSGKYRFAISHVSVGGK
jgi:phenylacetate-CoA ligase